MLESMVAMLLGVCGVNAAVVGRRRQGVLAGRARGPLDRGRRMRLRLVCLIIARSHDG